MEISQTTASLGIMQLPSFYSIFRRAILLIWLWERQSKPTHSVLNGQSLLKMDIVVSGLTSKNNYQILEFRANGQAIQRNTNGKYYISINNF
jgi:hypothetical protein